MSEKDLQFNNPPNLLTLARMAFVPLVVWALLMRTQTGDWVAAVLFSLAAITDFFDGWLARRMKLETVYGKLMDPLADKFLVVSSLIMLQDMARVHPVVVILVICREIAITGLRALASSEGVIIAASSGGKWKAATQMVAIPMIILTDVLPFAWVRLGGHGLLLCSLAMSLWSAKDYAFDFFIALKRQRAERKEKRALRLFRRLQARKKKAPTQEPPMERPKPPESDS